MNTVLYQILVNGRYFFMKQRISSTELFYRKKVNFVDREEIRSIVKKECYYLNKNDRYFRVIDIYGLGGMGKTCLLHTLKSEISEIVSPDESLIIDVSLEIDKHQSLKSLVSIRKQIPESCITFDYALISYWEKSGCIEKIDDSFMSEIRESIWNALSVVDAISDICSAALPTPVSIPSISELFNLVDKVIRKGKQVLIRDKLSAINQLDLQDLLKKMPAFLGFDIDKITEKKNKKIVFLCDSYQQSVPYCESKEWLLDLVSQIHKGLFVITGREKLKWSDTEKEILPYQLKCFTPEVARDYITNHIDNANPETIEEIISSSNCLPLFLDIAIRVYNTELNSNNPIDIAYFKDRESLMERFMYHLPERWHSIIFALSVIKVFNKDIFSELAKGISCDCPYDDYDEIVYSSLSNYINYGTSLVKLHDLFCYQAASVLSQDYKKRVWNVYLEIIRRKIVSFYKQSQGDSVTLFLNLLQCCIDMNLSITTKEAENILDIFFIIMDNRIYFEPPAIEISYKDNIKDILKMIHTVMYEKINSKNTVQMLESIKNPLFFGKHYNSYNIKLLYYKSLMGHYSELKNGIQDMISNFDDSDKGYWYYSYTKMYFSDYLTMDGKFISALEQLILLKNEDIFFGARYEVNRAIGHIYRFNMMLSKAKSTYQDQIACVKSISAKIHLQTNLCETFCFFDLEDFEKIYDETLKQADNFKSYRNIGKLYYSKAIVLIKKQNYSMAYDYINKSISINKENGYESGELFALIARAYCDYAQSGIISQTTLSDIERLFDKNHVYRFFRLPISIMKGDDKTIKQLEKEFGWLNFEDTVASYKRFINGLRPLK